MNVPKNLIWEWKLWNQGYRFVAGIDEAGRGPLAGPVIAAAVIFEKGTYIPEVRDSKKLRPEEREVLYEVICQQALSVGIGRVDPEEIDRINILEATKKAMRQAIAALNPTPEYLLIDAVRLADVSPARRKIPSQSLIKGDDCCFSIAAASIVAKVTRDRIMIEYDRQFPQYGFARHKGYYTRQHIQALRKYGPCAIHRRSFHWE